MESELPTKLFYHNKGHFLKSLKALRTSGGTKQQAAEQVLKIIGEFTTEGKSLARFTKHGESRISHCVKYDLRGACRLVTVKTKGQIWLLFVGDHDDTDRWIETNRGLTMTSGSSKKIEPVIVTPPGTINLPSSDLSPTSDERPLLERLTFPELEQLIPQRRLRSDLLSITEETEDDDLLEIIECLPNENIQALFIDIFYHLRRGEIDAATRRIDLHFGRATDLLDDPDQIEDALASGENSELVTDLTSLSKAEREKLLSDDFEPWMLWLHPDQKRVVDENYDSPCILRGISGSGKTIILLHRAKRLAQLYPGETIGILTLNRSLARLLENLLAKLCPEDERRTIKVEAFYDYFKAVIAEIGCEDYLKDYMRDLPQSHPMQIALSQALSRHKELANDFSPQNGETLDDTWSEFWRLDEDEMVYLRDEVKRALGDYLSFDVEKYIRDEFVLIRSAYSREQRSRNQGEGTSYFEYARQGRCIGFPETVRRRILRLLRRYEEYMVAGAMMDELALSQAILPARRQLTDLPAALRRRCLLIDEFQDFSTLELSLLKQIPTQMANGLFLVGDTVQKVMVKDFNLPAANLDRTQTRSRVITKNYRNSRQILRAAHAMVSHYGALAVKSGEAIEVLDPEFAIRETAPPRCIAATHPLDVAWRTALDWLDGETRKPWSVCLVSANSHALTTEAILHARPQGVSANRLSGDYILEPDSMVVGTLSEVKGFEFSLIIVVGCDSGTLPDPRLPEDEQWRDALRLYVAMTRGRDQVVLVHSRTPSPFLELMRSFVQWEKDDYRYSAPQGEPQPAPVLPSITPASSAVGGIPAARVKARLPIELSTSARMALLFYFERSVFPGIKGKRRKIQEEFNDWMSNPRNLHRLQVPSLFPPNRVRIDLANEIERYLLSHQCGLAWNSPSGSVTTASGIVVDELPPAIDIQCLYHFTERANLESIRQHGLLSFRQLKARQIPNVKFISSPRSQRADRKAGLDDYVRLAFIEEHPMEYVAREEGRLLDPVFLRIHADVLKIPGVKVATGIAYGNGTQIYDWRNACEKLDLESLFVRELDWSDPAIKSRRIIAKKYELLIPRQVEPHYLLED